MRIVIAALLGLLASSALAEDAPTVVRWGHIANTAFYWDIYIARSLGLMKDQNLDVQSINIASAAQSIPQVLSGGVDILSGNPEMAMSAIQKGADLVIISNEMAKVPYALMARPEINTISDLKGKILGVTQLKEASTSIARELLREKGNLNATDYELIQLGGTPNRYAALTRGAVQATLLAQPADFLAEQQGMRRLASTDEVFQGPATILMARRSWLKENGETATRFLRAATAARRWFHDKANRAQAIDILVKTIGVKPDLATKTYDLYFEHEVISKDGSLPQEHIKSYLNLAEDGRSSADPGKFVDFSFLTKAK
jgi:NitT/TauT family transport system substrate-binding protein